MLTLIVAADEHDVIGHDGTLPWHLPKDMERFKALTTGHPVIMGRKTWESLPPRYRPLPDRRNIVVTRQAAYDAHGADVAHSLEAALTMAQGDAFVIGGGELYRLALPLADRIEMTRVHTTVDGDRTFPVLELSAWNEVFREEHPADDRHAYAFSFVTYARS